EYLGGKGTIDECAELCKDYTQCLTSVLKERGIDKMLEEVREDHKENYDCSPRSTARIGRC
ncbi:hypothetical protein BJ875DRAFT_388199, partial [Amylocarpus encephaloides]